MDDEMSRITEGNVYCDLILGAAEAVALQELVTALRASGRHQVLDRVFNDILEEIERASELDGQQQPWP